jgi:peptidyl-prolyl cis-trans isomerase SurA
MEKIIVGAMRSKNVKTNSIVSPTKIDEYYRKHRDEFTSKEQIKLRMIMVSGHKDTASAPAQKELAEEVLGKLASGAEFEQMAQTYSEDSTKDNGGDWGWIDRKTLAEPLEKFAFNMPVGRISNIFDYAGNYYILKVEDKHGGSTKSLTEVRADIEKKLVQEDAQQIQERWIASLRQKAYIKTF